MGPDRPDQRLDLFLVSVGAGPSRSLLQKTILAGRAAVNGIPARPARTVTSGDIVTLDPLPPAQLSMAAEAIPLQIVYEDQDLLVIDKPRGLVVHPAAGNPCGTLVNALLAHCPDLSGIGGRIRPGIVHRLDKDTTGLLVVAKNDLAHLGLSAQLKERVVSRIYLALVHGALPEPRARLAMPIGRHPADRKRMAVVPRGRPAVTDYEVLEKLGPYSLLRLHLLTGRTHQIRVHLAAIGHPVAGDRTYGRKHEEELPLLGQALHAGKLSFVHPRTGAPMSFAAEPPADFLETVARLRIGAGRDPDAPLGL